MTEQPRLLSGLLLALIVAGAGCTAGASSPGPSPSPSPAEVDGGNSDGGAGGGGGIIGKPVHPLGGKPLHSGGPRVGGAKVVLAHPGPAGQPDDHLTPPTARFAVHVQVYPARMPAAPILVR